MADELERLGLPTDVLGPIEWIGEVGPDHAGRYEAVFAELRQTLLPEADELTRVLNLNDPVGQLALVAPHTNSGRALDAAFAQVMSQDNLVRLFGAEATNNRAKPFAQHFADRTRESLARSGAADNPYLWQVLQGRFPPNVLPPWLATPGCSHMPSLEFSVARMADSLAAARSEFDIVHLSNILDWLSPENARITLELAWKAISARRLDRGSTVEFHAGDSRFGRPVSMGSCVIRPLARGRPQLLLSGCIWGGSDDCRANRRASRRGFGSRTE